MNEEMNDSMSSMLLVGLSQSEWEAIMNYLAVCTAEDVEDLEIIIKKLINQSY